MAITKLNTIQSGVESNYSNNYIKQALSNLGQRSGTKGDSIINQDFKIVDIKDTTSKVNINESMNVANNTINESVYKSSEVIKSIDLMNRMKNY